MRVLVTGAGGQVGQELKLALASHTVAALTKADLDITDAEATLQVIGRFRPDTVIHAACYTNVDGCERDPEKAERVNADGTRNMAEACRQTGASLVYISTDYVFDGAKRSPYIETDEPNPLGAYGRSKLAGERYVQELVAKNYIVRTAWVFGCGPTFVNVVLQRAAEGKEMFGVTEEIGSPTWARDLAFGLAKLIETGRYGIYHLTNAGSVSRYEYMLEILRLGGYNLSVTPLTSTEFQRRFPLPTNRPKYSVLANQKAASLGITLRPWREALQEFICTSR